MTMNSDQEKKTLKLRLTINDGACAELVQDLNTLSMRARPERVRTLAMIGLACIQRRSIDDGVTVATVSDGADEPRSARTQNMAHLSNEEREAQYTAQMAKLGLDLK